MRFIFITTILLFVAQDGFSQFAENIASGRPGNANGPFSVGKGVYQVQLGHNFNTTSNTLSSAYEGFYPEGNVVSGPDVIFRIGIKEDFELRVGGSYTLSEETTFGNGNDEGFSGADRFYLGVRQTLFHQKGILPSTALQFTADFGGTENYDKQLPDAIFRVNFANRITEKLNLNWNFISRWVPDNSAIVGFYIFSFGYPLSDKFALTAELFGAIDETTKVNSGLGFAYLLNEHFQFDVYGSYGRNEIERGNVEAEQIAINGGISYRIVRRPQ